MAKPDGRGVSGPAALLRIVLCLAALAAGMATGLPAAAQLPSTEVDGHTVLLRSRFCSERMEVAVIMPDGTRIDRNSGAQDPLYPEIVDWVESDALCARGVRYVTIRFETASGQRLGTETLDRYQNWLPSATVQRNREAYQAYLQEGRRIRAAEPAITPDTPNPLADRGFYASRLFYEGDSFKAYLVKAREGYGWQIVFVHEIGETDPIVDYAFVDEDTNRSTYTYSDAQLDEYQAVMDSINLTDIGDSAIQHYVAGFHHPGDNPREVRSARGSETALITTSFRVTNLDRPVIDRERTQEYYLGVVNDNYINSVADARRVIRPYRDRSQTQAAETGPDIFEREATRRAETIAAGHVYKAPTYWSGQDETNIQRIFDGGWTALHVHSPLLRHAIVAYFRTRTLACPASFGSDAALFVSGTTTTTFNGYGQMLSQSTQTTHQTLVTPRFTPVFAYYMRAEPASPSLARVLSDMQDYSTGQPGNFYANILADVELARQVHRRIESMFAEEGCNSATLAQLEENLYRRVIAEPPVQDTGTRIPGAAAASDPAPVASAAANVEEACLAHSEYNPEYRDYCRCYDATLRRRLSSAEYQSVRTDYRAFAVRMSRAWEAVTYEDIDVPEADIAHLRAVSQCANE